LLSGCKPKNRIIFSVFFLFFKKIKKGFLYFFLTFWHVIYKLTLCQAPCGFHKITPQKTDKKGKEISFMKKRKFIFKSNSFSP